MNQIQISESKLIIVEGSDDKDFLHALIEYIGLSGIQIIPGNGKNQMPTLIKTITITSQFENMVTSLGVVRDADENANSTFQSIRTALQNAGLPVPESPIVIADGNPRVSVLIWPLSSNEGEIEDICLESIAEYPEMNCINQYFDCLQRESIEISHKISKAKVKAFLASKTDLPHRLGIAALKGYWPFDNPIFDGIKQFLKGL